MPSLVRLLLIIWPFLANNLSYSSLADLYLAQLNARFTRFFSIALESLTIMASALLASCLWNSFAAFASSSLTWSFFNSGSLAYSSASLLLPVLDITLHGSNPSDALSANMK